MARIKASSLLVSITYSQSVEHSLGRENATPIAASRKTKNNSFDRPVETGNHIDK